MKKKTKVELFGGGGGGGFQSSNYLFTRKPIFKFKFKKINYLNDFVFATRDLISTIFSHSLKNKLHYLQINSTAQKIHSPPKTSQNTTVEFDNQQLKIRNIQINKTFRKKKMFSLKIKHFRYIK